MVFLGLGAGRGGEIRSSALDMLNLRLCIRNPGGDAKSAVEYRSLAFGMRPGLEIYMCKLLA